MIKKLWKKFKSIIFSPNPKPLYIGFSLELTKLTKKYINDTILRFKASKIFKNFFYIVDEDKVNGYIYYYYSVQVVYPRLATLVGVGGVLISVLSKCFLSVILGGELLISISFFLVILFCIMIICLDFVFRFAWTFKIMHKANFKDMLNYKGHSIFFDKSFIKSKLEEKRNERKCSA